MITVDYGTTTRVLILVVMGCFLFDQVNVAKSRTYVLILVVMGCFLL